MSSTDADDAATLRQPERERLLALARDSISQAARTGQRLRPAGEAFGDALHACRASFVSIHRGGTLRGCIGHLEARQALFLDVNENAHAAARSDHRFEPVHSDELPELSIEISVLGVPRPLPVDGEQALLERLRPGIDGLVLQAGQRRATFLPVVWRQLPDPTDFVRHLKLKAGLPADYWSAQLECLVYGTESFADD